MKTFLCVIDLLPSGKIAAIEVKADDAITAERVASDTGRERFGSQVEVLEVLPTEQSPATPAA